jgi:hypothetical protein
MQLCERKRQGRPIGDQIWVTGRAGRDRFRLMGRGPYKPCNGFDIHIPTGVPHVREKFNANKVSQSTKFAGKLKCIALAGLLPPEMDESGSSTPSACVWALRDGRVPVFEKHTNSWGPLWLNARELINTRGRIISPRQLNGRSYRP